MASIPKTIGEFAVLPVQRPPLPSLALPAPATHFLYVRRHAPKVPTPDDDRCLFLANVPVDSSAEHFRALFASLVGPGRFESISFAEERQQRRARGPAGDDGEDDGDKDSEDDESDLDTRDPTLPGQAARLAALQSRKRKREGGSGVDDDDETTGASAKARELRRAAQLPGTWPRALRRSGSTAVARFADAKSVDVVLKAVAKAHKARDRFPVWPAPAEVPALGPAWLAGHNRLAYPGQAAVRASVDAFFALYNQQEAAAAERARQLRNVPDADGFVTVTRAAGGRSAPARQQEALAARAKQLAKEQQKQADMTHFYRFQLRERKKAEQAELLRKFQEDRKRVEGMRAKRGKFKPEA